MGKRVKMSPVDTAWLRMDTPGNLMMIVGVYVFDRSIDFTRLRAVLESRFLSYLRFRARAVSDATGSWHWEEVDDFDLDQHLIRVALPGKGTRRDFQKFTARLAGEALDPNRPLWQFHLIDNVEGGQAMVVRIHHAIADGMALIQVLMSMTSGSAETSLSDELPPSALEHLEADGRGAPAPWEGLLRSITDVTVKTLDRTGDIATRVLHAYGAILDDPEMVGEAATEYARVAAQVSKDVTALALMDPDSETSLKGRPGGSKVVAWNEPLSLEEVKAVGYALGASVNDVLLSCVAGAIRGYLAERGEHIDGIELRAMVPVNLRGPRSKGLGNKFGLVPLLLPVGMENPLARVYEVRARMEQLKHGYTAVLAMGLLGVMGLVPRAAQKQITDILASKATAVMTNVPGPRAPLYMAGAQIRRMMFWVPQSGDIAVGVSILSYSGGVQFGLITDKRVCREPQAIIDRFAAEFEKLMAALLLLPWGEPLSAEAAEEWLFPPLSSLAVPEPETPAKRRRRTRAATAPQTAAAPVAPAKRSARARPAGIARKRSAFAAAREG